MTKSTYEVGFGTSRLEEEYFQEVLELYSTVFNMNCLRVLRRKAVEFRFQSKKAQKLLQELGFAKGSKTNTLRVPEFIYSNKRNICAFLRGLNDTDGNAYWRKSVRNYYAVVGWNTINEYFAKEILNLLKILGHHPHYYAAKGTDSDGYHRQNLHRVSISRKKDVKLYLTKIGFRNPKRWSDIHSRPIRFYRLMEQEWARPDSNRGPSPCEGDVC